MAVINVQHARATAVHIISTILLSQAERLFTFADHLGTVAVNGCGPETQYLDASNWGSRTIYRSELHTLCALLQVLCMVLLLYAVGQSCDALMGADMFAMQDTRVYTLINCASCVCKSKFACKNQASAVLLDVHTDLAASACLLYTVQLVQPSVPAMVCC